MLLKKSIEYLLNHAIKDIIKTKKDGSRPVYESASKYLDIYRMAKVYIKDEKFLKKYDNKYYKAIEYKRQDE